MFRKFAVLAVLAAATAAAWAQPGSTLQVQERRIITFRDTADKLDAQRVVSDLHLNVVRELPLIRAVVVQVPLGRLDDTIALLYARPEVRRVEPDLYRNWLLGEAAAPALPSLDEFLQERSRVDLPRPPVAPAPLTAIADGEIPWGVARVRAPAAWTRTRGAGVTVAVVDTGIDGTHPDLAANFKGGVNIISTTTAMVDDNGHGTHVAGTIAAVLDSTGVVGVAPQAGVVGVKVLDADGSGWISDIIAGIQWVVDKGYPVINMSLGGPQGDDAFHDAIIAAARAGVTIVCAAGNSGAPREGSPSSVGYPAAYPETIAVSASDSADKLAYFSSRGPEVAFVAPGVDVKSTLPGATYGVYSGTSMATPHVAALAALAIAAGRKGPQEVRAALKGAAKPLPGLTASEQGAGMIDAAVLVGISKH